MAVQAGARAQGARIGVARGRRDLLPYMLILPIIIYEGIFILIPIIQEFASSFTSDVIGYGPVKGVGLANYDRMVNDSHFWNSIRVTLVFMVATVILAVGAGLVAALILNQKFRARTVARAIMSLPWAFPDLPTVIIFYLILNPNFGVINLLARFLLPWLEQNPKWLIDVNLAMPLVVAIASWKAFPFYGLVTLSVMQGIPQELYEAARVDGASPRETFRYVTLPEIVPTLLLMGVLACIFAFRQFVLIFLSTGGGPGRVTETLVISVYKAAFSSFDFSYGATLGVSGFVIVLVITVLFVYLQRRQAAETANL